MRVPVKLFRVPVTRLRVTVKAARVPVTFKQKYNLQKKKKAHQLSSQNWQILTAIAEMQVKVSGS